MFPEDCWGKGWPRDLSMAVSEAVADHGAVGPPAGLGYLLAAPTIVAHGNERQHREDLFRILSGQDAWCQLFSEPGAGSDLASLGTKAVRDGDEWTITGQKVWTSTAQLCNLGMLIARTAPDLPKHKGITYFKFNMQQPGVEIRPLREMTGRALFNEVFIDNARVHNDDIIGGLNNGWAAANTTLMAERTGLGTGGSGGAGNAFPGPIAGQLGNRAGEHVGQVRTGGTGGGGASAAQRLVKLAQELGRNKDASVRQKLVRLYTLQQLGKFSALRAKSPSQRTGGEANIAKLMMSDLLRLQREVGNEIIGANGMVLGQDTPGGGLVQEVTLFSPGPSIYGGTDQVQRNIIGERVLGLPKEPGPPKETPFKELLTNR
jgi:alkylation response protein AidB-like acyl-CoA dehydrogenase